MFDLHRHLDGSLRPGTLRELAGTLPDDLRFQPGMGLAEALSRFAFALAALRDPAAVARVAAEICEDGESEGLHGLEIRFAPQLHGDDPAVFIDAALEGAGGRADIILCGLYGEPPGLLTAMVDLAASRRGVVGVDLAEGPSPAHHWGLRDYGS